MWRLLCAAAQFSASQQQALLGDLQDLGPVADAPARDFEDAVLGACEHCDEGTDQAVLADKSHVQECLCLLELVEGRTVADLRKSGYFDQPLEQRADEATRKLVQTVPEDEGALFELQAEALVLRMRHCARFALRPMPWFEPYVQGYRQCCGWQRTLAELDAEKRAGGIFPQPTAAERSRRCEVVEGVQRQPALASELHAAVLHAEQRRELSPPRLAKPELVRARPSAAQQPARELFPQPLRRVRGDAESHALVEVGVRSDARVDAEILPILQGWWDGAVKAVAAGVSGARAAKQICGALLAKLGQMVGAGMLAVLKGTITTFRAVGKWALSGVAFSDDGLRVWPWCRVVAAGPLPATIRNMRVC